MNQNFILSAIKKISGLLLIVIGLNSCSTDYGEIIISDEKEGQSAFSISSDAYVDFFKVYLKNTSSNKVITFTIQKDYNIVIFEGENFNFSEPSKKKSSSKTDTYKLNPGELKFIGTTGNIDKSLQIKFEREFTYKIVGQIVE